MEQHDLQAILLEWRRHLHGCPETGFEEVPTSEFVARVLEDLGLAVERGIGGTGVVASLSVGIGNGIIGFRTGMDALNFAEDRAIALMHPKCLARCMHVVTMTLWRCYLGPRNYCCQRRDFNGTVRFIFQPAEEHGRGAKAMLAAGLLERYPIDEIYGLHNWPGMASGTLGTRSGGFMASEANFTIRIRGKGVHAARPHMGVDPMSPALKLSWHGKQSSRAM